MADKKEPRESKYIDPNPRARQNSQYRRGLEASKEIARLSEIIMLEKDVSYEIAQKIVFKKNPAL